MKHGIKMLTISRLDRLRTPARDALQLISPPLHIALLHVRDAHELRDEFILITAHASSRLYFARQLCHRLKVALTTPDVESLTIAISEPFRALFDHILPPIQPIRGY